jgi:hypothetical protein
MDFRNDKSLQFIAGPCAIESRQFALETAEELKGIFAAADICELPQLLSISPLIMSIAERRVFH